MRRKEVSKNARLSGFLHWPVNEGFEPLPWSFDIPVRDLGGSVGAAQY